ncbi:60S ribosomal protein L33A [Malassezia yamatoensis]|uniref:60S ribosomal protein L33A n=1 Tax=Malassezia yamatoensis TaxID=253288 RepID=A0AAJ5YTV1_9BASI|nr:60S ribosomal protein L33A [Malassezia yamatoensis]
MTRLYSKGKIMGHRRGKRSQHPNVTLVKIEGVESAKDAHFYLGKRIAYIYKAPTEKRGTRVRVIWGRVTRTHGGNGVVRSKFRHNIPPKAFGESVRVLLYPSNI